MKNSYTNGLIAIISGLASNGIYDFIKNKINDPKETK